jgi:hypothetical protein
MKEGRRKKMTEQPLPPLMVGGFRHLSVNGVVVPTCFADVVDALL